MFISITIIICKYDVDERVISSIFLKYVIFMSKVFLQQCP